MMQSQVHIYILKAPPGLISKGYTSNVFVESTLAQSPAITSSALSRKRALSPHALFGLLRKHALDTLKLVLQRFP